MGDSDLAFRRLEQAYQEKSLRIHELTFMYFDRIRSGRALSGVRPQGGASGLRPIAGATTPANDGSATAGAARISETGLGFCDLEWHVGDPYGGQTASALSGLRVIH